MATHIRTDEEIRADVLEELKWDSRVQSNEIGVAVKDGIVTLTGWVDSYLKKIVAEEAAHRVRGVKAVANDIEVRLPESDQRTDADIAAAVCRVFAAGEGRAANRRLLHGSGAGCVRSGPCGSSAASAVAEGAAVCGFQNSPAYCARE